MAEEAVLTYFDGRGRSEIIRMVLCAAKIKFREDNLTEREHIVKMIADGELLFNAVPLLKIDGFNIVQTNAILRYITGKSGLDGKDATEKVWVDIYFEGSRDFYTPFATVLFMGTVEEVKKKVEASLPKFMPIYTKALEKNPSGFLVGSKLTLADLGLMEVLLSIADYFGADKLADYPVIMKYYNKMCSEGCIDHYIKNVRKRLNDEKYVAEVKKVLNF